MACSCRPRTRRASLSVDSGAAKSEGNISGGGSRLHRIYARRTIPRSAIAARTSASARPDRLGRPLKRRPSLTLRLHVALLEECEVCVDDRVLVRGQLALGLPDRLVTLS